CCQSRGVRPSRLPPQAGTVRRERDAVSPQRKQGTPSTLACAAGSSEDHFVCRICCRRRKMGPLERREPMADERDLYVYLLPELAPAGALVGGVAVAIDVLRATTTIVHALAAGCCDVRPVTELADARTLADGMP